MGDVFAVSLDDATTKYFQYVAEDASQLHSQIIRVFKQRFNSNEPVDSAELVKGDIKFFAHVFLRVGIKLGYWRKVGNAPDTGKVNVYFRDSHDSGNPEIKHSQRWYVWKINEPFMDVGKLEGKFQEAKIGYVFHPSHILHRMRTGKYDFVFPGY